MVAVALSMLAVIVADPAGPGEQALQALEQRLQARFGAQQAQMQRELELVKANLEARVANLEAENAKLRLKPTARDTMISASVDAAGAGRRLSHSAADGCCRWTADNACGANITRGCTALHEYTESKVATHVYESVDSCPGANPSAEFDPLTGEVTLKAGGTEVARKPTPLKVTHPSDCSAASSMELQLNTTVGANLDVAGSLSVGGVDVGSNLASSPTWVSMDSTILASGAVGYGTQPYYAIMNGIVFLHGCIYGPFYTSNAPMATMPAEARPYGGWHIWMMGSGEGQIAPIGISAGGLMTAKGGGFSYTCLDGLNYRAA